MNYLCDSDVLIDFLNEVDSAISLITPLLEAGLGVSLITVGEVYYGVLDGRHPEQAEDRLLTVLNSMALVGLDLPTMRMCAELRVHLKATGMTTGNNDLLIAATALRNDLTLATRNRRHFDRIPDLRIYDLV